MKRITEPLHLTVKKKMLEKGIRQTDLIKEFDCSKSHVSMALNGQRQSLLLKIAPWVNSYKPKKAA